MLTVRPALPVDLPAIRSIYEAGRAHMRAEGNEVQWGGTDTPESHAASDIENGTGFVVLREDGTVCGVFAFLTGADPTYAVIEEGSWPDDEPYGTIHRIASDQKTHGVLAAALAFCSARCANLRIDTHEKNRTMRAALAKNGFTYAGIIHVSDGTPRLAFWKKNTPAEPV